MMIECGPIWSSPLCLPVGSLEDVVPAVEVHDSVLEMKFPLVPGPRDFFVLANDHLKLRKFFV
jgi:hypothetical protein